MNTDHMEEGAKAAYEAALARRACENGLRWLRGYGKDDWHVHPHAMGKEYVSWALSKIPEHVPAPTPGQVERGMEDYFWSVRHGWARRRDFTPTPEQVEKGLVDGYWIVRIAWIRRPDFTPTPEQIERGLTDDDWIVRQAWVRRPDFTPTLEQVERGLTDEDPDVRQAWEVRISESAT
jgi:hypothetical protein